MRETDSSAFSWVCPACGRRVPRKLDACRCGHARPEDGQAARPQDAEAPSSGHPAVRRAAVLAVGSVIAGAALGTVWMNRRPAQSTPPASAPRRTIAVTTPASAPQAAAPAEPPALSAEERVAAAAAEGKRLAALRAEHDAASLEDIISARDAGGRARRDGDGFGTGFFVRARHDPDQRPRGDGQLDGDGASRERANVYGSR